MKMSCSQNNNNSCEQCPAACPPPPVVNCCPCGPVFVLIRFPLSRALACKNSLQKQMSIHQNYSGLVSGISHQICALKGCWSYNKGVAILSFSTQREAELWKDSVPEIRQQDWMDGVDMIIVPVQLIPPGHKRFVELMDLRFEDVGTYLSEVSKETGSAQEGMGACREVVSVDAGCIHLIKGLWNPHYLVLNFWNSEEACMQSHKLVEEVMSKKGCFDINSIAFYLCPLSNPPCTGDTC